MAGFLVFIFYTRDHDGKEAFFMSKLSLHIGSEISLKDFSFSQLIIAVKSLFDTEGVPSLVKVLVILVEKMIMQAGIECPHCQSHKRHLHGKRDRKLKTSIGEVVLSLKRMRCQSCEKTCVPFNQFLDLDQYSRRSREFEKLSLETVTNQSFRRSAKNLNDTMGFSTAHSSQHRWFAKSDATDLSVNHRVDYLIADGAGFKKDRDENGSNRGEIRIMIGYGKNGEVIPFGAWTRASWKDIGRYVKSENRL
ncbi:MAG: hypothetical protein OM95_01680 [Bdellovibrio sp. ArHS]|uniref:transposase family protein n=1 Tax=Bdellovibrio sp. ArHS TaxID=1569284 RepID=UPI000583253F|nr:transposase family protein [Bdellovibrio sp. ArHS]KHD89805.1 MAG: hypothetical protein OM95_01680 [Bdellovibrio sp. ArHS]